MLIPLEDRVIVLQDEAAKETAGGLAIPDTAQRKPAKGTIVSVGPGKPGKETPIGYMLNGVFAQSIDGQKIILGDRIVPVYSMPVREGDKVLFSVFSGTEIEDNNKKYLVMRISDIITVIE